MMKKYIGIISGLFLAVSVSFSLPMTVLQDDFSGGRGDWATRVQANGATAEFANNSVSLTPAGSAQPVSVYHSFAPVTLEDGFTLRLTVNVSSANEASRTRDIRLGLGFADPLITGDVEGTLAVPLAGYLATAPSGGATEDSRIWRTGFDGSVNFFNNTETLLGDMTNMASVEQTPVTWVWEITRFGDDLVFGGSLNGVAFGGDTVTATGADVIDGYVFNTVALAHAYQAGQTVTFHDMHLEVIPEPGTVAMFLGLAALGLVLYRRK